MTQNRYDIYNASAGSGKTYTLASQYLSYVLSAPEDTAYRRMLAVTFTNKAVHEMKTRILTVLHGLAQEELHEDLESIAGTIVQNTKSNLADIQKKARSVFRSLIHDYSSFEITTIDSFNHRLLQVFAHDLKLPTRFQVNLDTDDLFARAVDALLARAGHDEEENYAGLTETLISYTISQVNQDKTWDTRMNLKDIAKLLSKETYTDRIAELKGKTFKQFQDLKKLLDEKIKNLEAALVDEAKDCIETCAIDITNTKGQHGIDHNAIKRIIKLSKGDLGAGTAQGYFTDAYTKKAVVDDTMRSQVDGLFHLLLTSYADIAFYKAASREVYPIALLTAIQREIELIKENEGIVPIYEFNGILNNEIKNQPVPFVYERLGEKYTAYYLDEFQDTSVMQWENLEPLIDNVLSSENPQGQENTLMLVGDVKQSIYRFRGGNPEQFLNLIEGRRTLSIDRELTPLDTNYRSYSEVIGFNNDLFKSIKHILVNPDYSRAYTGDRLEQKQNSRQGGSVRMMQLAPSAKNDQYILATCQAVKQYAQLGYKGGDICVLVKSNSQGQSIAQALMDLEFEVVSGDSLLLDASPAVQYLLAGLRFVNRPDSQELRVALLMEHAKFHQVENPHSFLIKFKQKDSTYELLEKLFPGYVAEVAAQTSLYEQVEQLARTMGLNEPYNLFIHYFLDFVYQQAGTTGYGLAELLETYEDKAGSLSVPAISNPKAIQIMTIHKAKGLEFPCVIMPFLKDDMSSLKFENGWVPVPAEDFQGFGHLYVSLNDCMEGSRWAGEIVQRRREMVLFDQINRLYVGCTRAGHHLTLIGGLPKSKARDNQQTNLILQALQDQSMVSIQVPQLLQEEALEGLTYFGRGTMKFLGKDEEDTSAINIIDEFPIVATTQQSIQVSTGDAWQWTNDVNLAADFGNAVHDALAAIRTREDVAATLETFRMNGRLNDSAFAKAQTAINQIVDHEQLAPYYSGKYRVIAERDILNTGSGTLRPDRLCINESGVTIIDYKTGAASDSHKDQVDQYAIALEEAGYLVSNKILVYVQDGVQLDSW